MGAKPLRISILILTRLRPEELKRCLLSLIAAASASPGVALDAWVCANGADPATASALASMPRSSALPVQVVALSEALTPGAARNRALEALRAAAAPEWVFFIDDDAYVDPAYLGRFLEARAAAPDATVLGGPNLTPPRAPLFSRATGVALSSRVVTYFSSARYRPLGGARETGEEELSLCNLFIRGDALAGERFPEQLFFGEESWLLDRLRKAGKKLVYDPKLALLHDRRSTPRGLARQVFRYGAGRARNLAHDRARLRWAHVVPSVCVLVTLAAAVARASGLSFAAPLWLGLAALYLALCAAAATLAGARSGESIATLATAVLVIPLIHVSYGVGFLWGWLRRTS